MHPDLLGHMVTLEHRAAVHKANARMASTDSGDEETRESRRVGRVARLLAFRFRHGAAQPARLSTYIG